MNEFIHIYTKALKYFFHNFWLVIIFFPIIVGIISLPFVLISKIINKLKKDD
jgi:hypothetical protein